VLNIVRVGDVMRKDVQPALQEMTVAELAASSSGSKPLLNLADGLPIIDKTGQLVGIVTQGDLLRALELDPDGRITVLEAGSDSPVVAYPDELVAAALHRMLQRDIGRLPVVSREDPRKLVGYLNRSSVLGAWSRQIDEEGTREHGWFARWQAARDGGTG